MAARRPGKEVITLPVKRYVPGSVITRFASNMTVQTLENESNISFFEAKPEIRVSPTEKIPSEVVAECVASVIVKASKLPSFINALKKHLDAFIEIKNRAVEKPK